LAVSVHAGSLEPPPGPVSPTRPPDACFDNTGNRFVDCGDGTIKDTETGLYWLKSANCFGFRYWTWVGGREQGCSRSGARTVWSDGRFVAWRLAVADAGVSAGILVRFLHAPHRRVCHDLCVVRVGLFFPEFCSADRATFGDGHDNADQGNGVQNPGLDVARPLPGQADRRASYHDGLRMKCGWCLPAG